MPVWRDAFQSTVTVLVQMAGRGLANAKIEDA